MESSQNNDELHPIIQQALYEVDDLDYQVGWYELFIESDKKAMEKWQLSEDESQWNQNAIGNKQLVNDVVHNETLEQLTLYKQELEDAKILLRIYMEAFNGGWEF